jgi:ADP-heptose:LPS heptosyltransferase
LPKILVIRFSSIGDIVLASPVFRCVKKQIEGAEIHFLTKASFRPVTEHNPYIDRFFYFNDNLKELVGQLKKENYDFVVDLHNNLRSNRIKRALRKKTFTIDKLTIEKFLLTQLNINVMPGEHITQRSLKTVFPLGVVDDGYGLDYFISDNEVVQVNDIPTAHQAGYIAIAIGANHFTKKLPVHKLKELCSKITHPIILLGGKEDIAAGEAIAAADPIKVYNSCGKFSLNESADLIRKAKLVISHDTGLQYIACAFNRQVLAIWGGTSPKLDVEPYYGSKFLTATPLPVYENIFLNLVCQPCSRYGSAKCPLEHFHCMEKQDIDAIVKKVNQRLGRE